MATFKYDHVNQTVTEEPNKKKKKLTQGQGENIAPVQGPENNQVQDQGGSSSGFVNLQKYLNANQSQADKLGKQIADPINERTQTANEKLQETNAGVDEYIQQKTPTFNQEFVDQAANNTTEFVQNEDNLEKFNRMRSGNFEGEQNFNQTEMYQPLYDFLGETKSYADLKDNVQTRKRALEDIQENDRAGITNLNQLLVQNDPEAREMFQEASNRIENSNFDDNFEAINQRYNTEAQEAQQRAIEARDQINERFLGDGGVRDQFRSDIDDRIESLREEAQTSRDDIFNALRNNADLNKEQLDQLGITADEYNKLREMQEPLYSKNIIANEGLNKTKNAPRIVTPNESIPLASYLNSLSPDAQITKENAATMEDIARQNALNQLLGIDENYITENENLGTASPDVVDFDYKGASDAILQKLKEWEEQGGLIVNGKKVIQ